MKTSQKGFIKIIILVLAILAIVVGLYFYIIKNGETNQATPESTTSNFLGSWSWVSSDKSATFSLNLTQGSQSNSIDGDYCATARNGNRIDCYEGKEYSFKGIVDGTELKINFIDAYGGGAGVATITYNPDDSIVWKITEKPDGYYYIPDDAALKRDPAGYRGI